MASSSTATHNQTELENSFEQPQPYLGPQQNLSSLTKFIKLLQEWCLSILNVLGRICLVPFRRFVWASRVSQQTQSDRQNAFDQLAPVSASTSTKSWQIFINHRGPDVKYTFACKIQQALDGMGFRAFLDVEAIEPGDVIPEEIKAAMTSASLHIAIFSPTYAQSKWCLDELAFMLQTPATIIPVFYHVEPSDLRWTDKGKYADAFAYHERKGRYTQEKLNEWKKALHDISLRSGFEVKTNEDEARVLKNIENSALKFMNSVPLSVAEHPLGLDELVQGFESLTREDEVKITGIVGMGGSGKTTLAKELFNRNSSSFERCSFVADVRDAASRNALPDKQKKLLRDLGVKHLNFDSVDEGTNILANRLSSLRVLIVLDDVDHIDQVNALLPNKNNLGSQSMVIITTRELGVLKSCRICIYKMPGLERSHAEQLFCWHAFLQSSPPAGFQSLVEKFIQVCDGLPLSLKVLGGQLYGNDSIAYWESLLDKISRILPGDIIKRLQVSYDALDKEEKEMFLDVACFLIGEWKNTAIALWDGSRWSGLHGLQTLVNKCLVELVYEKDWETHFYGDKIRMHDHLRDMGREIASRHSPYRVWRPEQKDDLKMHFKNKMPIRGIRSAHAFAMFNEDTRQLKGNSSRRSKRLNFSNGLQILSVVGNEFTEKFASLSEDLVWLRWAGFPLENLPPWLTLRHLSVLELYSCYQLKELWKDNEDAPLQLRQLTILGKSRLERLPCSIGRLKHLKILSSRFYGSSLPEEFCGLHSLEYLYLDSPTLLSLPDCFGNLISLKNIKLESCKQLSMLPESFKQLIHLEKLDLSGCEMLSSLPDGFGNLINLKDINLLNCDQLSTLPESFKQLIHLEKLNLFGCNMLSSLPDGFGNLINLKDIDLRRCVQLSTLPESFGNLTNLKGINLSNCDHLSTLPESFGNLINLKHMELAHCYRLSMLPESFGSLIGLQKLELSVCDLTILPDSFKQLIHLEVLNLEFCSQLQLKLDMLENIRKLKFLNLDWCCELEDLPHQIVNQASLTSLYLRGCVKLRGLPTGIGELVSLKYLWLHTAWKVPGIQSLENLERLEELVLACDTISAVKPCIQSLKECPSHMLIRGSVSRFAEPIVNSLEFPDLTVMELELPSNVWGIVEHFDSVPVFCYVEGKEKNEDRKVVRIGVSLKTYERTMDRPDFRHQRHSFPDFRDERRDFLSEESSGVQNEKAIVVKGRVERVVEAFNKLLALLE